MSLTMKGRQWKYLRTGAVELCFTGVVRNQTRTNRPPSSFLNVNHLSFVFQFSRACNIFQRKTQQQNIPIDQSSQHNTKRRVLETGIEPMTSPYLFFAGGEPPLLTSGALYH